MPLFKDGWRPRLAPAALKPRPPNLDSTSLAQAHGGTTSYGYDAVSRLTSHSIDNPGDGADNAFTLSYNPAGQVVERTTSHQAVPFNEHANLNRSDSVNGLNQISQSGSATVTHDARGNMTSDGTRTFGYRSDNAMTSASGGVTLSYDPLGRLYEIAGPSGSRQLVHDGASLVQEYGSGSMAAAYVHGPRIDEPLVEYDIASGQRRHLMSDDRGSIIAPADDTGLVLGVNRYDEYGVPSSSNSGRFQYNGQPWLPEIGMYYSRARMYDHARGRFPQPDPIGYGDGPNLYNAFGADPVNRSDPSGTRCEELRFSWHWYYPNGDHIGSTGEPDTVYTLCPLDVPNTYFGGGGGGGGGGSDRPGHDYEVRNRICDGRRSRCRIERTNTQLCAIPGRLNTRPVGSGRVYAVYDSIGDIFPAGFVRSYRTGLHSYWNVTTVVHPFRGTIDRTFSQSADGSITAVTRGTGTAFANFIDRINQRVGPEIFNEQDRLCGELVGM